MLIKSSLALQVRFFSYQLYLVFLYFLHALLSLWTPSLDSVLAHVCHDLILCKVPSFEHCLQLFHLSSAVLLPHAKFAMLSRPFPSQIAILYNALHVIEALLFIESIGAVLLWADNDCIESNNSETIGQFVENSVQAKHLSLFHSCLLYGSNDLYIRLEGVSYITAFLKIWIVKFWSEYGIERLWF